MILGCSSSSSDINKSSVIGTSSLKSDSALAATSWKLDRIHKSQYQSGRKSRSIVIPATQIHSGHFIVFKNNVLLDIFNNCHQQDNISYRLKKTAGKLTIIKSHKKHHSKSNSCLTGDSGFDRDFQNQIFNVTSYTVDRGELVLRSKLKGVHRELIFKEKYHNTSLQTWRKAILKEIYLSKIDLAQDYLVGKANRIVIGINKNIKNHQSQKNKVISALTKLHTA